MPTSPTDGAAVDLARRRARCERELRGLQRFYRRAARALAWSDARLMEPLPEVSAWSPAQHLFHLALATELVVRNLRALRKGSGRWLKEFEAMPAEARAVMERGILPRGAEAPRMVRPPDTFERAFLAELLSDGRRDVAAFEEALDELAACTLCVPHQDLGDLDAIGWLRFARMHGVHHWRIVRRIDAARGGGR